MKQKNQLVDVNKIKQAVLDNGDTLAKFGRKIGITNHQVISMRLLNKSPILADELFLMADELGVKADDLRITV